MVALDHVGDDVLRQMHGRAHVEIDQLELVVQIGVGGERAAGADAGVQREHVDRRARSSDAVELVDARVGARSTWTGSSSRAETLQLGRDVDDPGVLGGDDQIEVVRRELLCELISDARRMRR